MTDWVYQIELLLESAPALIMVTVLRVQGSVPREAGSRMLITADRQWGTIGGGNLEYTAVRSARTRLAGSLIAPEREVNALGPSLGQCCGGTVELLFETIDCQNAPHTLAPLPALLKRSIDQVAVTRFERAEIDSDDSSQALFSVLEDVNGDVLVESTVRQRPAVWVFGAGHVGAAVIKQLALLPCDIVWLDERESLLADAASSLPGDASLRVAHSDDVVSEVAAAPVDTCFVVMTHSHFIDYELCRSILSRPFAFLGLIGSRTKRRTFEHRLKRRGVDDAAISRMVCPIGIQHIQSNHPHAIALSLAAQLLQHWETDMCIEKNSGH